MQWENVLNLAKVSTILGGYLIILFMNFILNKTKLVHVCLRLVDLVNTGSRGENESLSANLKLISGLCYVSSYNSNT